ncbi:hypothetical protein Tco_0076913 [Tanacetum coccineum]
MFTKRRDASEMNEMKNMMTLTFRNEMNEMKNMMKALMPTPTPIKAVEERCTTCGSNHSYNVCPMTRGGYEYPVYHDNVQNGNSGYRPPNLANQIRPPGFNQQNNNRNVNANQGTLPKAILFLILEMKSRLSPLGVV